MKIIFLDIDCVLNFWISGEDEFGFLFHEPFCENLKHVIEKTNAKIVLSSDWRFKGLDFMQKLWKHRNLAGEIIGITPDCTQIADVEFYDKVERGHEVKEWITIYNHFYSNADKEMIYLFNIQSIENYCIIDDCNDMLVEQSNNFVRCANLKDTDSIKGCGLTEKTAKKVIEILNKKP